jgi:hypothetical protein
MSVLVLNHFDEVYTTSDTVKQCQISNTGEVKQIVLTVPAFTAGATLTIVDENGTQLYSSGLKAAGSAYVLSGLSIGVSSGADRTCIVVVTLSAPPSIGGQVLANIWIKA